MMNKYIARALSAAVVLSAGVAVCGVAFAQPAGADAAAAKSMLQKAVAAVKANEAKAIDTFNTGEDGFYIKDRDLFPFCFTKANGKIVATQTKQALGKDVRTFKDKSGKAFGQEIYDGAKDGQISEVSYVFGKPGAEQTPVPKVSFVTGVADLGCAVGYYK